jgi:hypothetical protein
MGGAWERLKMCTKFWLERLNGRQLGGLSGRREYNSKENIRKTGFRGVDWIHVAQDRGL